MSMIIVKRWNTGRRIAIKHFMLFRLFEYCDFRKIIIIIRALLSYASTFPQNVKINILVRYSFGCAFVRRRPASGHMFDCTYTNYDGYRTCNTLRYLCYFSSIDYYRKEWRYRIMSFLKMFEYYYHNIVSVFQSDLS